MSISHGPHGCHLKDRCVSPGEDMVPEGEQGADYRTVFRKSCTSVPGKKPDEMHNSHTQELQNMMGFALRALEFCLHCLDASPWPFLLKEVLENYALAVEGPDEFLWHRAAGRTPHFGLEGRGFNSQNAYICCSPPQIRCCRIRNDMTFVNVELLMGNRRWAWSNGCLIGSETPSMTGSNGN
ncbi:unnamed protein product [Symbiodinium microadriaticum]|nr:unnamed protein product [Symbiodinium microadriaticum]